MEEWKKSMDVDDEDYENDEESWEEILSRKDILTFSMEK